MFDLYRNTAIGDTTTYVRPYHTISTGPLNGQNTITIFEELVVVLPDASTQVAPMTTAEIKHTVIDPNETFDVVNPITGEVTGTMTFAQLKVQMYSLYLYLAAQRDGE